ncbi:SDR family oxidoreductase [uncultured Ferrovibrio sp.]|jgi:3-oxoacyl-[acyl-carrier protein] reductase|uniref:SDR family oxidoreductase n=1 Tax=uncultured Ferrovibrio sp. TaxID=1576913 RepID=UPI00261F15FB|nr:SDR family oxidoreductase [uncultured Ferrovibrio sp.]
MDFGISGRNALVCAASKGLGFGCALALAKEGVNVTITARNKDVLEEAAQKIRAAAPGVTVKTVAGDITTEEGRQQALAAAGTIDILVTNAGGPPPGDFRDWDRDAWIKAVDANMITPILLTKAVVDGMAQRKFGRIVNITSNSVKAPIPHLGLSNGARAGLTGFISGVARQVAKDGVTINNLLPGRFLTDRLKITIGAQTKKSGAELEAEIEKQAATIPAGRFGTAEEFGQVCAFLCSVPAAYLTAQNILLDGGSYPGTF